MIKFLKNGEEYNGNVKEVIVRPDKDMCVGFLKIVGDDFYEMITFENPDGSGKVTFQISDNEDFDSFISLINAAKHHFNDNF